MTLNQVGNLLLGDSARAGFCRQFQHGTHRREVGKDAGQQLPALVGGAAHVFTAQVGEFIAMMDFVEPDQAEKFRRLPVVTALPGIKLEMGRHFRCRINSLLDQQRQFRNAPE